VIGRLSAPPTTSLKALQKAERRRSFFRFSELHPIKGSEEIASPLAIAAQVSANQLGQLRLG